MILWCVTLSSARNHAKSFRYLDRVGSLKISAQPLCPHYLRGLSDKQQPTTRRRVRPVVSGRQEAFIEPSSSDAAAHAAKPCGGEQGRASIVIIPAALDQTNRDPVCCRRYDARGEEIILLFWLCRSSFPHCDSRFFINRHRKCPESVGLRLREIRQKLHQLTFTLS